MFPNGEPAPVVAARARRRATTLQRRRRARACPRAGAPSRRACRSRWRAPATRRRCASTVTPPREAPRRSRSRPAIEVGGRALVVPRGRHRLPAHPAAGRAAAGARCGSCRSTLALPEGRIGYIAGLGRHDRRRPGARRHRGRDARRRDAAQRRPRRAIAAIVVGIRAYNTRAGAARRARAADALRRARRHGGRAVQHHQPARAARRADRPVPVHDRARARHRRDRGDGRRSIRSTRCCARRTGSPPPTSTAGCRSAASTSPRAGTSATSRSSAPPIPARRRCSAACWSRATASGRYVYTGPRVLPAAPGRRAGRVPAVRQPRSRAEAHDDVRRRRT